MKLVTVQSLISRGAFPTSEAAQQVMKDVEMAILSVRWPPGAPNFTIHPLNDGNGVKPIKLGFVAMLAHLGWRLEQRSPRKARDPLAVKELYPGAFDAWIDLSSQGFRPFVAEWETGNISSSHRSINRMALALLQGHISGGVLVLPTRDMYNYLTDRVGNYRELAPYFPLFSAFPVEGLLTVLAVEHDAMSTDVPPITKGTDGRALI